MRKWVIVGVVTLLLILVAVLIPVWQARAIRLDEERRRLESDRQWQEAQKQVKDSQRETDLVIKEINGTITADERKELEMRRDKAMREKVYGPTK